jgi:hypothetical protein
MKQVATMKKPPKPVSKASLGSIKDRLKEEKHDRLIPPKKQ